MKKTYCLSLFVLTFFLLNSPDGHSQSLSIGPRAGLFLEDSDLFIGAEADIQVLSVLGLHIVPSIDKIFSDEGPVKGVELDSKWLVGINAVYDLVPLVVGTVYTGGGVGFFREKREDRTKKTDTALNIIGGIRFNVINNYRPFANARLTLNGSDSSIVIEGGLYFSIF